jgi:predicted nuclease with TOPRIM domain
MSAGPAPKPQTASVIEFVGRIRELQAEIAEGTNRRARLAGENAVLMDLLDQANQEIVSLRAMLAEQTPQASAASGASEQTQAPTLN